jgi:3-oxoacyl-[acyl-carrier protein] reductase
VKHNAKCGLTSVSKALSADVAHANVTLNNLLPERINTSRQQYMAQRLATQQNISVDKAYRQIAGTIAAGQPGLPEEFADACAFLCT